MTNRRGGEYLADVGSDDQHRRQGDPFDIDFAPGASNELRQEYADHQAEIDREPAAVHAAYKSMDADCKLVRDLIRNRQGIRSALAAGVSAWRTAPITRNAGVPGGSVPREEIEEHPEIPAEQEQEQRPANFWGRTRNAFRNLREENFGLQRSRNVIRNLQRENFGFFGTWDHAKESWFGRTLFSMAVGAGVRTGLSALQVSGGPLGALAGMATGGIFGYVRGKNQTESAATWMHELGITNLDEQQINNLNEAQLERVLGILKNAIEEGRVRGSSELKMEMAIKYRIVKNRLIALTNEAIGEGRELNPILDRISAALACEQDVGNEVSKMVAKQYENEFKELLKLKRGKMFKTVIKGAVIGGTIGGVFEFVHHHGGIRGTIDWIREHIEGLRDSAAGGEQGLSDAAHQALEAKRQALEQSTDIQQNIAEHQESMSSVSETHSQMVEGNIDPTQLPQEQLNAVNHYDTIKNLGEAGSVEGFRDNFADNISQFDNLLKNGDLHSMAEMTNVHNIDLQTMVSGEHFGQYLIDNKDTFLQFPPEIQNFILSHPSVAPEFMNIASNGAESVVRGLVDKYSIVLGMAALGAGWGGYAWAHREQKDIDNSIANVYSERLAKGVQEMNSSGENAGQTHRRDAAEQRTRNEQRNREREQNYEGNRRNSIAEIRAADSIQFMGQGRLTRPAGMTFHVEGVNRDRDGRETTFVLQPLENVQQGTNYHDIAIDDYLDAEGNINRRRLQLTRLDRTREQEREQHYDENRQSSIEELRSAESIEFTGGPGPVAPAGGPAMTFRVQGVNRNREGRETTFVLEPLENVTPGTNYNNVDIDAYLDQDGNIDRQLIQVIRPGIGTERNLRIYENLLNHDRQGHFVQRGTERIFIPDMAINQLPNGIRIEGLTNAPTDLEVNVNLRQVRIDGNEPIFTADVTYLLNRDYYRFIEGFETPRDSNARHRVIEDMVDVADGNMGDIEYIIYIPSSRRAYLVDNYDEGADQFRLNLIDPVTHILVGAGATNLSRADLERENFSIFERA